MSIRILLIEDDEVLREVYEVKLTLEGFDVDTAVDGKDGLEKALKYQPDVILLDMLMPRMTGLEFLSAYDLRHKHPNVTILVMSNKSSPKDIEAAKLLGVVDYLVKSHFTPEQIVQKIRSYLAAAR